MKVKQNYTNLFLEIKNKFIRNCELNFKIYGIVDILLMYINIHICIQLNDIYVYILVFKIIKK